MCDGTSDRCCCGKPQDERPDNPADCSPEQIKECHGDVEGHPCVPCDTDKPEPKDGGCCKND